MHDRHAQPRSLETIDDDMVMAVFHGDEALIARLQQERASITDSTKGRIEGLGVLGNEL